MLQEAIVQQLNQQIERENNASNHYLAMASWAEARGFAGSAEFLYYSANEERDHMLTFFRYVNANGGHALVPQDREAHADTYEGLRDVFQKVSDLEGSVTQHINNLSAFALEQKDFATFHFLGEFVKEQQEAVAEMRYILDLFDVIGTEGHRIFLLDKEIRKILLKKTTSGKA